RERGEERERGGRERERGEGETERGREREREREKERDRGREGGSCLSGADPWRWSQRNPWPRSVSYRHRESGGRGGGSEGQITSRSSDLSQTPACPNPNP